MDIISPSNHLPTGESKLVNFIIENIEIPTVGAAYLGAFMVRHLPLLLTGFMVNQMLFPLRRDRIREKTMRELYVLKDELETGYLYSLNEQADQILTGAGSLLECYQKEYKSFFDGKWKEFKKRGEAVGEKIKRNELNLHDMELIENMIAGKREGKMADG